MDEQGAQGWRQKRNRKTERAACNPQIEGEGMIDRLEMNNTLSRELGMCV